MTSTLEGKGPFTLEDVAGAAASLNAAAFRERHGDWFLVRRMTGSSKAQVRGQLKTMAMPPNTKPPSLTTSVGPVLVYPVRKSGTTTPSKFISVGRTLTSDVALDDASVSLFQAAFTRDPSNGLRLHDGDSSNGTLKNGARVPTQDDGEPVAVEPGDKLLFGGVEVRVMNAEGLLNLLAAVVVRQS